MLKMAHVNCIRTLRQWKGRSISEISRTLGVDWRTAKKYADGEELPEPQRRSRESPKTGPFMEHLEAMILEDMSRPAKQRRTAKAMYEVLVGQGYEGSQRTVRHWVSRLKPQLYAQREERFVRLEHSPGEAQMDFQQFWMYGIYPDAVMKKLFGLVMSFPYSNAAACHTLPAENAECMLSALVWMFEDMNGVPPVMVFDNLSPAVKAINGRDRQLTELFSRFRWHYQFEARFCNPGSPHEKGNVERKVGYVRRNVLSPPPVVRDLAEIDELLRKQAEKDLKRIHYRKGVPVEELWEEDRRALLPLPNQRFEVSRLASARVNRVSEIRFEGDTYRIPRAYPGQGVILRVFWDRLVVLDQGTGREVGRVPRQYAYDVREVDWKAELEIFVNKPRAVEQAVCLKAFPAVLREFILSAELEKRPRRIRALLALFDRGFDLSAMEEIVHLAGQYGRTDEESLKVVAGYRTGQNTSIEDPHTPEAARNWRPDMNRYALLTPGLSDDGQ